MSRIDVPVLVVGGGPVGLMGGVLLAQQGLANRVVEKRAAPQRAPAAHVVNARSFEICRAAGIDMQAIRDACMDPADGGLAIFVTRLAGEEIGRLPFERQGDECLRFTPTPLRNLAQHRLEPILLESLRKTPATEIHYGHCWEGSEVDASGVVSTIRDLDRDTVYEVHSRYLIGADGAGSRVRKQLGIDMNGPPRLRSVLMLHFEADLRDLVRDRPGALYWLLDPATPGTFVAHDIDREWVYMAPYDADHESPSDYDDERCRELIARGIGRDDIAFELLDRGAWTMSSQVADRMRDGRSFLAGDSAHRFPPTGGLGLNSGIQDIHGLAWRLGAVERGWAPAALLDSYEVERLAIARNNAEQSLRNVTRLFEVFQALGVVEDPTTERMHATLDDPAGRTAVATAIANQAEHFDMLGLQIGFAYEHGALVPDGTDPPQIANPVREYLPSSRPGARLPHAWLERDGVRISSLDLIRHDGFTLLTREGGEAWEDALGAIDTIPIHSVRIGDGIRDPDGRWAAVSGIAEDGALLVRPDQHVAWRSHGAADDPPAALRAALAEILGSSPAQH